MAKSSIKKLIEKLKDGAVELYDEIIAIEAKKGKKSLWKGDKFRHDFSKNSKAKVLGLEDGSVLIIGNKKLWKNKKGYKKGIDYK